MARLLIYDAYENKVYTYANLNENDPMPYSTGTTCGCGNSVANPPAPPCGPPLRPWKRGT